MGRSCDEDRLGVSICGRQDAQNSEEAADNRAGGALAPAPKRSESQWNPSAACPKTAIGHRGRRFRLESVRYIVVAAY
jgi:hypothetical protein